MFGIESSANNSFIQFLRSAVSANFVFKASNDLNHKTDAHLREANNFLDVASICTFTDGRFCIKQRLFFSTIKTTSRCYFLRVEKRIMPEKTREI